LLSFLATETSIASIKGIGRVPLTVRPRPAARTSAIIENTYLLPYLQGLESGSVDIVYSRYVMEQHSIHAWVLLTSRIYWRYLKENKFNRPEQDYPSSRPNLQAIFKEACRIIKPGGIIISQIAKKRYSALDGRFLEDCRLSKVSERELGKLSTIVTVVK
jgi:hypothetical protein